MTRGTKLRSHSAVSRRQWHTQYALHFMNDDFVSAGEWTYITIPPPPPPPPKKKKRKTKPDAAFSSRVSQPTQFCFCLILHPHPYPPPPSSAEAAVGVVASDVATDAEARDELFLWPGVYCVCLLCWRWCGPRPRPPISWLC